MQDNAITIPEVGRDRLASLTLDAAEAAVFDALVAPQIDPTFSIEVAEFNPQRVAVGGTVTSAKAQPITLKPLTLSQALSAASGLATTDRTCASPRLCRDGSLFQIPLKRYLDDPKTQQMALKDDDFLYVDSVFNLDRAQGCFTEQIQRAGSHARIDLDAVERGPAAGIARFAPEPANKPFHEHACGPGSAIGER